MIKRGKYLIFSLGTGSEGFLLSVLGALPLKWPTQRDFYWPGWGWGARQPPLKF